MNNDIFARNAKLKQKLIAEYGEELFNKAVEEAFWLDKPYPRYVMAILRECKERSKANECPKAKCTAHQAQRDNHFPHS